MLTETDIHYLAGLLSLASHPDNVEIELGNRVLDATTGEGRDVDITILLKDADKIKAFKGLEVKNHSRKLDTTHVEQLACKLNDMPEVTERAIVSATGYTRPAIRKAKAHGIILFELCDWDFSIQHFEHFKSEFVPFIRRSLEWAKPPGIKFRPTESFCEADREFMNQNPKVFFGNGETNAEVPDLESLLRNFMPQLKQALFEHYKDKPMPAEIPREFNVNATISGEPYLTAPSGKIVLDRAMVTGEVKWVETRKPTHYKILRRLGEEKPYAGCVIADLDGWGLVGISVSRTDRNLRFLHVSIADRNKKKIFKQRIQ